ncbi:MAG: sigma-70 family RNA polymerase sigma factor, partial [Candidatus Poribacteria bacterium]
WRQLDSLHEPRAFGAWFKRILHTQCGRMTRGRLAKAASLDEIAEIASSAPTPYEQVESDALRSRIQDAIEELPEHERTTAILRYIHGYTQAEIADFMEAPLGTVKYRLHSARKRLRKGLADMARDDLYARRPSRDDGFVKTVLFEAVKEADVEKVATLLPEHPALVESRDGQGHTPMQALGRRRHFITASDSMESREAIYGLLVARGSEPDIVTAITVGDVAPVRAIAAVDPGVLRRLVVVPSWKGITPLAVACGHGRLDVVEALLDLDPSTVNVIGEDGATGFDTLTRPWHPSALGDDALSHRREVYDMLVRHGGEPRIRPCHRCRRRG